MAVDINTHKLDLVFNSVIADLQCDQVRNCRPMKNGSQMSLHVLRSKIHDFINNFLKKGHIY